MKTSISIGLALWSLFIAGCGSYRVIEDWELPDGYHGWVVMERATPKCPEALLSVTSVVLKVDSSGHGCTSTSLAKGPRYLRFYELDSTGHRRELGAGQIWEFTSGMSSNEFVSIKQANEFFVGTESEYQSRKVPRPQWGRMQATRGK